MFTYDEEVVDFWLEKLKTSGISIAEEIEEIKGTISNERLWLNGASSKEESMCHMQNIADLSEYLSRLEAMSRLPA